MCLESSILGKDSSFDFAHFWRCFASDIYRDSTVRLRFLSLLLPEIDEPKD